MSRKHQDIYVDTKEFQAIERGEKKFVITGYVLEKYDMIHIKETTGAPNYDLTGRELPPLEIQYVEDIDGDINAANW